MPVSAAIDSTSAALGALLATLALYPLDVAKTRIQAEPGTSRERGTLAMCARIAREDGPLALLVGVTPKAVSTVLSNFAFFYFLAALKRAYSRVGRPPGTAASLAMGSLAGALNMSVTLPTETVTTRLQAASAANQEGLFSSMANIYDEEGILGCVAPRRARRARPRRGPPASRLSPRVRRHTRCALGRSRGVPTGSGGAILHR